MLISDLFTKVDVFQFLDIIKVIQQLLVSVRKDADNASQVLIVKIVRLDFMLKKESVKFCQ